ncbi:hypothetical protein [Prevotella histicola]|uniref:hypothetical protein n=1 Tax=Prevotella histicola TaxID=470565 RepID=UPI0028E7087D|nr:hypothetical protein [Prevotella histicola]
MPEAFYYRLQHTKPIFLTLITDQRGIGQSQHDTNVGHYDLSAFIDFIYGKLFGDQT